MIPVWVVKLLERAKEEGFTGTVAIAYRGGAPKHAKREEVIQAPEEPDAATIPASRHCPKGCGTMSSLDYGNLYICAKCGTKRTRAQLLNPR